MKLTLDFLTPGLNGKDGLIRQHFRSAASMKVKLRVLFLSQKPRGHVPINYPVKVIYIRYTSRLMDWDNACSSFKHIGDALRQAGIISEDSPDIIHVFEPKQIKCRMNEQRTEIIIEPL